MIGSNTKHTAEIWYLEDDADLGDFVSTALNTSGFNARILPTANDGRTLLKKRSPNVLLVDWNLPDADGCSICSWARQLYQDLPIIMVTVRDDPADIVMGLEAGADDYLAKPFDSRVLISRIRALLRRTTDGFPILTCGNLQLDKSKAVAFVEDESVALTASEYQLLHLLMRNKGRIVTRDAIREELWGIDGTFVNDNSLTVAMRRLRHKLGSANYIKTVRSFGYRLEDPQ